MTFQHVHDPSGRPAWTGVLPGSPDAYFLSAGEGEHAVVATDLFTVLLSGDETEGQFGVFTCRGPAGDTIPTHSHDATHETFHVVEGRVRVFVQRRDGTKTSRLLGPGDFGYVPAGLAHAYRIEQAAHMIGTSTGGFERFFQQAGTPTDSGEPGQPPFLDFPRMAQAAARHGTRFDPGFSWPDELG